MRSPTITKTSIYRYSCQVGQHRPNYNIRESSWWQTCHRQRFYRKSRWHAEKVCYKGKQLQIKLKKLSGLTLYTNKQQTCLVIVKRHVCCWFLSSCNRIYYGIKSWINTSAIITVLTQLDIHKLYITAFNRHRVTDISDYRQDHNIGATEYNCQMPIWRNGIREELSDNIS